MSTIYHILHPEEEVLVEARISPFPVLRGIYLLVLYAVVCVALMGILMMQTSLKMEHFTYYYQFLSGFGELTAYVTKHYPGLTLPAALLYYLTLGPIMLAVVVACMAYCMYGVILRLKTELAVTNLRMLAKVGWIARDIAELHHNMVQDVFLSQSVLGRIFDYGTITLRGYGGVIAVVEFVHDPMYFRSEALEEMERVLREGQGHTGDQHHK